MAKQRVQVRDLSAPPAITPQAEQVNVFHNPLTPMPQESNAALELAQGLAVLRPSLYGAADIAVDKETKQGEAQALLAERTANRDGITSAVKAGAIPAGASPWFQKGWNRQKNRILADQYATDLQQAYAKWGDRDNTKGDLQAFMQAHLQSFIEQRDVDQSDPEFTNVFAPMASQVQSKQNAEYGAHKVNLIEKEVIENTGAEVSSILDLPYLYGGAENQAKVIQATLAEHVKNGADGTVMNKVAVDAITQQAIAKGDLSLLDQMDLIDTGNGRLGRTLYAKEERLKAQTHIISNENTLSAREEHEREEIKKQKTEQIYGSFIEAIQKDRHVDVRPYEIALAKIDPDQVPHLRTYQKQFLAPVIDEQPEKIAEMYRNLAEGKLDNQAITDAAGAHLIDGSTISNLYKEKAIILEHKEALTDPIFKQVKSLQWGQINGDPLNFDLHKREKASIAEYKLSYGYAKFLAGKPQASEVEKLKYLEELSTALVGGKEVKAQAEADKQEAQQKAADDVDLKSVEGIKSAIDELNSSADPSQTTLGRNAEMAGLDLETYVQALSAAAKKKKSSSQKK